MCREDGYKYKCAACGELLYNDIFKLDAKPYCKKCYKDLFDVTFIIANKSDFSYISENDTRIAMLSEIPASYFVTEYQIVRAIISGIKIIKADYNDRSLIWGAEQAIYHKIDMILYKLNDMIERGKIKQNGNTFLYTIIEVKR